MAADSTHARRSTSWLETVVADVVIALRQLRRAPGIAVGAILTIALGVGGGTAIFSVVDTVLLRPLPFGNDEELVRIQQTVSRPDGSANRVGVSQANLLEIRERSRLLASTVGHRFRSMALSGAELPERVVGIQVSDGWLETIGVAPAVGRGFTMDEHRRGEPVVVLGYRLWQRRFHSERSAIGSSLAVDGVAHTIVGVMPSGYAYPYDADLWVPLGLDPANAGARDLNVTGRMLPGVTAEDMQRELAPIAASLVRDRSENRQMAGIVARPMRVEVVGDSAHLLYALLGAVAFVLVIACVNVANLLLARATTRRREFSIRAALGASRARIAQQLLTESVLLALLGGALGIAAALVAGDGLSALIPASMRDLVPVVQTDVRVLLTMIGVCVATGVAFGAVPALRASRVSLSQTITAGNVASAVGSFRMLHVLAVTEVSVAVALLAGGGVLLRDLQARLTADTGIDAAGVLTASVSFPESRYAEAGVRSRFVEELERRLTAVPGVSAAGVITIIPFETSNTLATIVLDGAPDAAPSSVNHRLVSPGAFGALGVRLVRGRLLNEHDVAGTMPVAVVSESMARRYWPERDPLGARIRSAAGPGEWTTVVGVVSDIRQLDAMAETWYVPYAQAAPHVAVTFATLRLGVVMRGHGDIASLVTALRGIVAEIDPALPVHDARPLTQGHEELHATARLGATITGAFAMLGLVLAAIGIFGVISYATSRRTREIGIRMALGARPVDVMRGALRESLGLVGAGVVVGVVLAAGATRLIASTLIEVGALDPVSFGGAVVMLMLAGAVAGYLPARRAARIDPLRALRTE